MQLGTPIPGIVPTFIGGTQKEAVHWATVYSKEQNLTSIPKCIAMCHLAKHIRGHRPQTVRIMFCGSYLSNKNYHFCYNELYHRNFSIEFYE